MGRWRQWRGLAVLAVAVGIGTVGADENLPPLDEIGSSEQVLSVSAPIIEVDSVAPMRLSMEFQDANLKDVLKVFSQQTGINVIAGGDVGDQPITLYLEQVAVLDALDQILRVSNLMYERPAGSDIYIVKPADAVVPTITRVYRLKYARVSSSNLAQAAAAFAKITPFEAVISSGDDEEGGGGSGRGGGGGAEKVGVDVILSSLLTDRGSIAVDGRTNSLVMTDVAENFPRLEAALAALDVRTAQIMIEAELIETNLNKLKDLGVEWGTGTEGTVFSITPARRETRFPFSTSLFNTSLFDGIAGYSGTGDSDIDVTLGSINFSQAVGVLQALELDTDSKILARPKVLTLDNEPAIVRLTTNQAIGFTATGQATTGTTTSEPEREMTGIVLVVTPQVNEHGYITMLVEPSVTKTVPSKISAPEGQSDPVDPKTRSTRTLVRIRSGDTLVIGGLIDRSEEESVRRVPILSGVPFLGAAFRNTEIDDTATELIIFITPRILEDAPSEVVARGRRPLGVREQEPVHGRQDAIEHTLNIIERDQ